MLENYLIVTASAATIALIWRWVLIEHPSFAQGVHNLPLVGPSLYCGFCAPLWFSLIATLAFNPIAAWPAIVGSGILFFALKLLCGWLCVGIGVLFLRNAVALLMDASALLSHQHQAQHEHDA